MQIESEGKRKKERVIMDKIAQNILKYLATMILHMRNGR